MACDTKEVHLHNRIAVRASALKKTGFSEEQKNKYLLTTVGKVIFNSMFPEDFPYLNEVSKENFEATPDRYFLEMGQDVKQAIADRSCLQEKGFGKNHR